MMIYEKITEGGKDRGKLYTDANLHELHADLFSPGVSWEGVIFEIGRGSYQEQKQRAREIAQRWQELNAPGLSWYDLSIIGAWFEKTGRRYGLLQEYHENCII